MLNTCTCTYIYIYIYTERERDIDRERERYIERERPPCCEAIARVAAINAVTLLKNDGVLPLKRLQ